MPWGMAFATVQTGGRAVRPLQSGRYAMADIGCRVAETRREIDGALRLRWAVFGEELGLLGARPAQREVDEYDLLETTVHIVAYAEGEAVATGRVLLPNAEVAYARGWGVGIDLERRFDLGPLAGSAISLAEATRLCVLRPFRRGRVIVALLAAMIQEGRRRGVTHCVTAANTQTDVADDALVIEQVAAQRGLVSLRHRLSPRARPAPPAAPRAPLYDAEARLRAAAGDAAGLSLPRPLEVFAGVGLRIAGPAIYDMRFQRFAVPMVGVVDEMAVGIQARSAA
jgi:predicted GNAT family N-acyltransferase